MSETGSLSVRQEVRGALKWSAIGRFAGQLLSWASTIVVMRILEPSDYGLMALAMGFIGFLLLFNELGFGASIINSENISDEVISNVFGAVVVINVFLAVISFLASPVVSLFFSNERLDPILKALSVVFVFAAFGTVPQALLEKQLNFKAIAIVRLISTVCGALVTLALALVGAGVWALIFGYLVIFSVRPIGYNLALGKIYVPKLGAAGLSELVAYGGTVAATRVLWYFYRSVDVFIIGRVLGNQLLGFYSVAMELASIPMSKVSSILSLVAFPAFSRFKEDREQLSYYLVKAVRLLGLFAFPVLWGLGSVGPEVVSVLLGEKWQDAVLPMQILCVVIPFRMINSIIGSATQGAGRADVGFFNMCMMSVLMPPLFFAGTKWGVVGVSIAWVCGYIPLFFVMSYRSARATGARFGMLVGQLGRPVVAAAVMAAVVWFARSMTLDVLGPVGLLFLLVPVGVVAYLVASWFVQRDTLIEFLAMARG